MTIEQTVEIPADRRIFLDVPVEMPTGRADVIVRALAAQNNAASMREASACLRGISKRFGDSLEAYFARKQHDKELELEMEKA